MADSLYPRQDISFQLWVKDLVARINENHNVADPTDRALQEQILAKCIVTGIDERDPEHPRQVHVGVMANALADNAAPTLRRDYDSLLGFTEEIPTQRELFVWSVPRLSDTLTEPLHMKIKMRTQAGAAVSRCSRIGVQNCVADWYSAILLFLLLSVLGRRCLAATFFHHTHRYYYTYSTTTTTTRSRTADAPTLMRRLRLVMLVSHARSWTAKSIHHCLYLPCHFN